MSILDYWFCENGTISHKDDCHPIYDDGVIISPEEECDVGVNPSNGCVDGII